jgi:hypothetical protein
MGAASARARFVSFAGKVVLDVPPESATPTVISSYLALEARHLL